MAVLCGIVASSAATASDQYGYLAPGDKVWMNITASGSCPDPLGVSLYSNELLTKESKLNITAPVQVEISGLPPVGTTTPVRVVLSDGTIAYTESSLSRRAEQRPLSGSEASVRCLIAYDPTEIMRTYNAEKSKLLSDLAESAKRMQEEIDAKAAEQKRLSKLPGVSVGMTAKQVRYHSSWGAPESINRTTVKGATDEQWVYPGNQYLYFRNGRLYAIQNSE